MAEERKIKQRANIYLYYWAVPVLFAFIALNYFTRNFKIQGIDFSLMISIVTFIFGFLISITFSMLLNRSSNLKDALAGETGRLVSLYLLSKHLGENFSNKVREKIDSYTIGTLRDYHSYDIGRKEFYELHNDLNSMEMKEKNEEIIAGSFLYVLGEWEVAREKLEYLTGRKTEWSLKLSNYLLGGILIILLYLNRTENTFTNSLFIILSTIIVFVFFIIEDYDHLRIGDYAMNISNSEQLFDLIGKERYYPEFLLSNVKLQPGKYYRIGFFDNKIKEEKIYRIQYNPQFNIKINHLLTKFKK